MRLLHRVNVASLEIFNELNFQHLSICQVANAAWRIILASFLGSGETPPSDNNLEVPLCDRADN
jgi:hypothetical protein